MATSQWWRFVAICWSALLSCSSVWAASNDTPPFYQIQFQGKTAYLLGSIHIGRADFYPMPAQVESAFDRAKGLVVEIDLDKVDSNALLQQYGMANKAKGLDWSSRDQQTMAAMKAYCAKKAELCQSLKAYAPWLQASQLNLIRYKELGYSADYGVDSHLLEHKKNLPVFELETAQAQFQLLASFDAPTQWSMVREAIEAPNAELLALVSAWRAGSEAGLDKLMREQLASDGDTTLLDKILWQRNHTMADGVIKLMSSPATPSPLFVVVGAGHVVGDKSVVQLLKQSGATVSACWRETCQ